MQNLEVLELETCERVAGGMWPVVAVAVRVLTNNPIAATAGVLTVIGAAADLATALISDE